MKLREKEEIVRTGYDRIAEKYQTIRHTFDNKKELGEFASLLPTRAKVLDVGCGAGIPVAKFLVECDSMSLESTSQRTCSNLHARTFQRLDSF